MGGIDTWIQGIRIKFSGLFQVSRQVSVVLSLVLSAGCGKTSENINRILGMITAVPKMIVGGVSGMAGDWWRV